MGISEGKHNLFYTDYAYANKIKYIIGDEIDVLKRLIQCGEKSEATDIFRVSTESPFLYYKNVESAWNKHVKNGYDVTFLDNIIDGCGFEIITLDALKISHWFGENKHRSELYTLYIREHKEEFNIQYIIPPNKLQRKDIRLTVDYPEDLIVCRAMYNRFKDNAPLFDLDKIIEFLDESPVLKNLINPFCEEGYSTMYL